MFGLLDFNGKPAPMLHNFTENGGLFPNGALAVLLTMITVNYSFQGTELIGIASGESENPEKTIPKAIKNTIWRTLFFFVLAISVVVGLLPWQEANLVESPFVLVFDVAGVPYATRHYELCYYYSCIIRSQFWSIRKFAYALGDGKTRNGKSSIYEIN